MMIDPFFSNNLHNYSDAESCCQPLAINPVAYITRRQTGVGPVFNFQTAR